MLLKEFRYVLTIAECGTISKAAEKLYISQPALTKYIHNLEEVLNIKLFEKVGRTMQLTAYGHSYVEAARKILGICDDLEQEVYASDDMLRGTLRIGGGRRSAYIIPKVIPELSKQFPSVYLSMCETSYDEVENMLLQGKIDLGIIKESPNHIDDRLCYVPLFEEELVLVTAVGHPLSRFAQPPRDGSNHPWIDLKLFADENFILYKVGHRNRYLTNKLFMDNGIEPRHFFDTNNIEGALHLAQEGYGVCFSPEVYANNLILINKGAPAIQMFSVGNPVHKYRYCVAYRRSGHMTRYAIACVKLLKETYKKDS